jgi:LemA protein
MGRSDAISTSGSPSPPNSSGSQVADASVDPLDLSLVLVVVSARRRERREGGEEAQGDDTLAGEWGHGEGGHTIGALGVSCARSTEERVRVGFHDYERASRKARARMLIAIIVVAIVAIIVVVWALVTYNRLVRLTVSADEGESEIDVQLKRRHDLIPNLVETVKGYAAHERGTLERVTEARGAAMSAEGPRDRAAAEGELSQALGRLFALSEAYPDLKADQNFLELQRELTATEDRIQAARRFYNTQVEALNTKIQSLPSKIVARAGNFSEREFFELEDRSQAEVPSVAF